MPKKLPTIALILGLSGLIPQIFACYLAFFGGEPALAMLVGILYAALILSFLGGLLWGVAVARDDATRWLYFVGVCPSLLAFGATLAWALERSALPYVVVGATLLSTPIVDAILHRRDQVPVGWLTMRLILSTGLGLMTLALALKA